MKADEPLVLKSEFAHVSVSLSDTGQGPRLLVRDHLGGQVRYVDPLELECFVRAETSLFDRYLPFESSDGDEPQWPR